MAYDLYGGYDPTLGGTWQVGKGWVPSEAAKKATTGTVGGTNPTGDTSTSDYSSYAFNLPALTTTTPSTPTTTDYTSLAEAINTFNTAQQQQANAARIPNAAALESQSSANIGRELAGTVPTDVINQLGMQAAERGISIGSPSSANADAAYLRALGLTSYDLTKQGQADLTSAYARNPSATLFDLSKYMETPYQQQQIALAQQQIESERQQAALKYGLELANLNANRTRNLGTGGGNGGYGGYRSGAGTGAGTTSGLTGADLIPDSTGKVDYSNAPVTDQELEDWIMNLPYTGSESGNDYGVYGQVGPSLYSASPSTTSGSYYDISGLTGDYGFEDWANDYF